MDRPFLFVSENGDVLDESSSFYKYLTKIDPHILSKGDRAYIISGDMKQFDIAECNVYKDYISLDTRNSLWTLRDHDNLVYKNNDDEIDPIGRAVYAIVSDSMISTTSTLFPNIRDGTNTINSIYVNFGNQDILMYVYKLYAKDIEEGDFIVNNWLDTYLVSGIEYDTNTDDTDDMIIGYIFNDDIFDYKESQYEILTVIRLRLLGG